MQRNQCPTCYRLGVFTAVTLQTGMSCQADFKLDRSLLFVYAVSLEVTGSFQKLYTITT